MKVHFSGAIPDFIEEVQVNNWLVSVCERHGKVLRKLSYHFMSDDELLDINRRFLDHDFYTDIITFDYCKDALIKGEIYISIDRVRDNASQIGVSFEMELYRVIVHGCLHLIGFDDHSPEEKEQMREEENKALILQKF